MASFVAILSRSLLLSGIVERLDSRGVFAFALLSFFSSRVVLFLLFLSVPEPSAVLNSVHSTYQYLRGLPLVLYL